MDSPFLGIDHIGIAVRELGPAEATYRDLLGFPVSGGEELPERGLSVRFVDTGNARIELIAPTRPDSEVSKFLEKRGEGVHHICVRVRDIDATVETMRARGAQIVGAGISRGAHGTRVAFIHPKSTSGVLLELVEHRDG